MTESNQLQQLAAILGPKPASTFEILVSHLISCSYLKTLISHLISSSSSNEQRSQAEIVFNICKQTDPDSLSLKLAHLLQSNKETRVVSAVLLRKQLLTRDLWPRLSPNTQSTLKFTLLSCIQLEDNTKSISKNLCSAISELASRILPDNGWPELLPFLFKFVSSNSPPKLQESSFWMFAQLSSYLVPRIEEFHTVILYCLSSRLRSDDVKIAAFNAVINFIGCLTSFEYKGMFKDVLIAMTRTLIDTLNYKGNEGMVQEAIKLFIELAATEPRLLTKQIVLTMLQIAGAIEVLKQGTRHLAVECLMTLAEARDPALWIMRNSREFIIALFPILMRMVSDINDDPLWHKAETDDDDVGVSGDYSVGQECLHRLAIALGGKTIVPVALENLTAHLATPEWQKHHAALIALAQIAEGCSEVMIEKLEQVVTMVLNSFQHSHMRVRWSAINAIGQLSTDLGPDLQVQYHQRVLPALVATMQETYVLHNPHVLARAASAVHKFSENCTRDILTPYLDGLVSQLIVLVQCGIQMVQVATLTAVASVVVSCQEHFQKYYDDIIVNLRVVLMNATFTPDDLLWTKSLECIRLVGMAVGKEKFRDEAKKVMEVLKYIQRPQMEADDPTTSCMLQACADLCKCLGQDFLPYISVAIPPLLQFAQLKPDETITSANDNSDIDESDDESMDTITLGDKRIRIKTSVLEEKAKACNMLCCYADELKEGFFQYIDQVAPTLVPLISYIHEKVRKSAVSAMLKILLSAKLAIDKGQAQGCNEIYLKQLSDYIVPALVEALPKECDSEIRSNILEAINECKQIFGSLLDESHFKSIKDIKQAITPSSSKKREREFTPCSSRKRERAARTGAEDFDDEDREVIKEENFDQVNTVK
ncbi:hypothetical protein M0R45_035299 [Rubus argutus]|uniref:IPO4/5-like TPR repeats domain-containing protein n=1 Tax=Rubus argutus TaxID=59490 RepID=A0AAW1VSL7_RUBAR